MKSEKSPSVNDLSESCKRKHQIGLRRGWPYPQAPIEGDEVAFEALPPLSKVEQEEHSAEAAQRQVQNINKLLKIKTPKERWEKLAAAATDSAERLSAQEMFVAAGMCDGVGVKVVKPWIKSRTKSHARLAKIRDALNWAASKAAKTANYFDEVAQKFKSQAKGIEEFLAKEARRP